MHGLVNWTAASDEIAETMTTAGYEAGAWSQPAVQTDVTIAASGSRSASVAQISQVG